MTWTFQRLLAGIQIKIGTLGLRDVPMGHRFLSSQNGIELVVLLGNRCTYIERVKAIVQGLDSPLTLNENIILPQ